MHFLQSEHFQLLETLLNWDRQLFFFINRTAIHPLMDQAAIRLREAVFHIPLYLFLLYLSYRTYGKIAWKWFLGALLLVACSDMLSSQVIKAWVGRHRPCRDLELADQVRLLASYCGANGSFTSSHAVNHFAFATYAVATLGRFGKGYLLLFLWAAVIAYSQVYVGVHFPTDVLAGGLLGALLGWMAAKISNRALSLPHTYE
ncbi:MAG: phosphatase PAP2 family protein [Bacteroidetes bacterium]|nr:phosphatase PAP2 family protein [Bacteroidota bacterium]